jgi:DNA invertase Pin-like site-specific DNA recombinase
MAQIGAVFAELERSLIAERTAEALTELRQQGRAWNHAPFGWDAVDGRLVANATEQITLNRLRDLRASGTSYHKVAAILDGEGRATKRGGPWQAASVCSVLRTAAQLVKTSAA